MPSHSKQHLMLKTKMCNNKSAVSYYKSIQTLQSNQSNTDPAYSQSPKTVWNYLTQMPSNYEGRFSSTNVFETIQAQLLHGTHRTEWIFNLEVFAIPLARWRQIYMSLNLKLLAAFVLKPKQLTCNSGLQWTAKTQACLKSTNHNPQSRQEMPWVHRYCRLPFSLFTVPANDDCPTFQCSKTQCLSCCLLHGICPSWRCKNRIQSQHKQFASPTLTRLWSKSDRRATLALIAHLHSIPS